MFLSSISYIVKTVINTIIRILIVILLIMLILSFLFGVLLINFLDKLFETIRDYEKVKSKPDEPYTVESNIRKLRQRSIRM